MRLSLPRRLWYGNDTLEIDLPDEWQVQVCPMQGAGRPALSQEEIDTALASPVGSPPLAELAQGKQSAVIIFDDMTRPTRIAQFAPFILGELSQAGVPEDNITFVCALGCHGALTFHELRKKLSPELVERFRVFNHNCYENCEEMGVTAQGTPVMINREVVQADLRVAISCVTAHPYAGYSGGSKILMPGVAHIDTVAHNHLKVLGAALGTVGLGKFAGNQMRGDLEEAAGMVGLDFLVNVLVNQRGEAAAMVAGGRLESHARAVELAAPWYASQPRPANQDLVIANAFVKANEMPIAAALGRAALKPEGGTVVVIADAPEGQVVHYLLGRFGREFGGRKYPLRPLPEESELIIMAPHLDRTFGDWFPNPEVISFTRDWPQTLSLLRERHREGSAVAVLPDATMQYFA
ncbi:MAG: lactate racemase domain-containing protein [Desulfarculaceae bacterium]|nr:lactate racemase domain-containing protein [Desulfarculaceae bacterium]MCF8071668.1 lactate racemase domain-containing protein [Desulfarculaceae bacterium]MCF8102485.1 lactate racemase domain-containing protein [Desulfarculaceae bacterium]MCF8114947.1 lactate racemase domain-containing protein [Desulfarculaceae bacterium]